MSKVIGMGNALVDIMTRLESDALLHEFNLPKGSMQLVDSNAAEIVSKGTHHLHKQQSSGGSAANTIHGLASLGIDTGFIGTIGEDEFGLFFHEDLMKNNIHPKLFKVKAESGRAIALISPDSERTFATYLGAAIELSVDHLTEDIFDDFHYFHIEGYLVQNHDLIRKAVELAKAKGLTVSLDLASFNVVEANLGFLKEIIKKYVDIVFANEEEAKAFTGLQPEESLHEIAKDCDIAVVKVGKNGSLIKKDGTVYTIGVIKADSIDTTGAGDVYASGFIYGLVKGLSMQKCGEIGAILSGKVIEVIGAKMDSPRWDAIRKMVADVEQS
ncbi:MAG: adenosine kinase [Bacteroidetes bacterium]|nr:adenosine kinase [Bacteroidota bacterium]